MKYIFFCKSYGTMAPGLHNALKNTCREGREDIISTSLRMNGMEF